MKEEFFRASLIHHHRFSFRFLLSREPCPLSNPIKREEENRKKEGKKKKHTHKNPRPVIAATFSRYNQQF